MSICVPSNFLSEQKDTAKLSSLIEYDGKMRMYSNLNTPSRRFTLPSFLSRRSQNHIRLLLRLLETLRQQLSADEPITTDVARLYDSISVEAWMQQMVQDRDAALVIETIVRKSFGCECTQVSMLHLLLHANACGGFERLLHGTFAQQRVIVGGTQQLAQLLADKINAHKVCASRLRDLTEWPRTRMYVHACVSSIHRLVA